MPEQAITLRPATAEDAAFLFTLYASTREAELASTGWSDEQKHAFCAQQFHAQDAHYRKHYTTAQFFIIEVEKQPAGRLYVDHWEKEIRIMDIALLPKFRGQGIGTHFLRELQKQAQIDSKMLSIHVETYNPARRLYERLGFIVEEDHDMYHFMTWKPESGARALVEGT